MTFLCQVTQCVTITRKKIKEQNYLFLGLRRSKQKQEQ